MTGLGFDKPIQDWPYELPAGRTPSRVSSWPHTRQVAQHRGRGDSDLQHKALSLTPSPSSPGCAAGCRPLSRCIGPRVASVGRCWLFRTEGTCVAENNGPGSRGAAAGTSNKSSNPGKLQNKLGPSLPPSCPTFITPVPSSPGPAVTLGPLVPGYFPSIQASALRTSPKFS